LAGWRARAGAARPSADAADAAGRFGAIQQLADNGAVGGIAVRGDGAAVVAWAHLAEYQITDQAMAAVRAPGASAFGPAEAIAPADHADPPAVAFDPASGDAVAAWPARPTGTDPSQGGGQTAILRIARRPTPNQGGL
jgi:hypothetical protein